MSEKIRDESSASAALTLSVSDHLEQHFEELERAFFAAGEVEPAGAAAVSVDLFDDLSVVAAPEAPSSWRARLVPLYRLARLWLSIRMRLLLTVLRGAVPSALERLSPRRLALPLLVRAAAEVPPRFYARRPYLTVAAAVVLGSTLVSVWAGVVLAATRWH